MSPTVAADTKITLPWALLTGTTLLATAQALAPLLADPTAHIAVTSFLLLAALPMAWYTYTSHDCDTRWPKDIVARIPRRTIRVAAMIATALAMIVTAMNHLPLSALAPLAVIGALWGLSASIDLTTKRMPAPLIWGSAATIAPLAIYAVATDAPPLLWGLSLAAPVILTALWAVFPRGMGLSDVRLMWAMWLALFWWTPPATLAWGLIAGCVLQLGAHAVLALKRQHARHLPFGPALLTGVLLAANAAPNII